MVYPSFDIVCTFYVQVDVQYILIEGEHGTCMSVTSRQ